MAKSNRTEGGVLTPAGAILPKVLKPEHDPADEKRAKFLEYCRANGIPPSKLYDLICADPSGPGPVYQEAVRVPPRQRCGKRNWRNERWETQGIFT